MKRYTALSSGSVGAITHSELRRTRVDNITWSTQLMKQNDIEIPPSLSQTQQFLQKRPPLKCTLIADYETKKSYLESFVSFFMHSALVISSINW